MLKRATLAALVLLAGTAAARADAPTGEVLFRRFCMPCHSNDDTNRLGPHLVGIVGRPAGAVPGYGYSTTLRAAGIGWSEDTLDRFITAPTRMLPGSRMFFPGVAAPADRAALIAYLKTR